jgi:hypothetical protein
VLAQAAAADADGRLVARVLDPGTAPEDVAFVALGGDLARQELMARLSTMDYTDLRIELMGVATLET